jgi:hypothetical protein
MTTSPEIMMRLPRKSAKDGEKNYFIPDCGYEFIYAAPTPNSPYQIAQAVNYMLNLGQ